METAHAIEAIVARHESALARYLTRIVRDRALAEDLMQETWLRVHRALPQLRNGDARTAWLYRIALNVARDHLRRRHAVPAPMGEEHAIPNPPEHLSADARLEQREVAECVRRRVAALPPALRGSLVLRDFQGLGEAAAAEMLGASLGAVKLRTHRARKMLREQLQQRCGFSLDARGVVQCAAKGAAP